MSEQAGARSRLSRRRFLVAAVGGAGVTATAAIVATVVGNDAGDAVRTFDVVHADGVYVTMTNGRHFVVEVKERGTRRVLERHDGVTAESLLSLRSDHVSIVDLT